MKNILIFFFFLSVTVFGAQNPKNHQRELNLIRGIQAYNNKQCVDNDKLGAITYFNNYIKLDGNKDKVIKFLAFCYINEGIENGNKEFTNKGFLLLEQFYKKNKDKEVLKLLYSFYISSEKYKKAEKYNSEIVKLAKTDKELYLIITRYQFQIGNFKESIKFSNNYLKINKNHIETLSIKSLSLFELGKYKEAKIIFQKLEKMDIKDDVLKTAIKERLDYINSGKKNKNQKKNKSYEITINNAIFFDSNIASKPLEKDFDYTNYNQKKESRSGIRNETYINIDKSFLEKNKHSFRLGGNLFSGLHYPEKNKSNYDILSLSIFTGYNLKDYFKDKYFKYSVYLKGDMLLSDILNNPKMYHKGFSIINSLFLLLSDKLYSNLNCKIKFNNFITKSKNSDITSQDGIIYALLLTQGFMFSDSNLNINLGYSRNQAEGSLFRNNSFSFNVNYTIIYSKVKLNLSSAFTYKLFSDYEKDYSQKEQHTDREFSVYLDISYPILKNSNLGLKYNYLTNSSTIDIFNFNKYVIGGYFNITF